MDKESPSIRLAVENDVDEIFSFEYIAQQNESRQTFIRRSIATKSCYVASYKQIVGYAVLEYSFYEMGFVSMLYVHSDWQRYGIGTKLLKHLESICLTDRLFTSTNLSNVQMQALLAKLGYKLSGVIHDLDEDDPELVYVKYLQQTILVN
jgi:ribosomal protein S18 acetylase RimI-like enzyme